jgi:hypothetical protein
VQAAASRTSVVVLSGDPGLSGQAAAAAREWTRSADRGEGRSEPGRAGSLEIASVLLTLERTLAIGACAGLFAKN